MPKRKLNQKRFDSSKEPQQSYSKLYWLLRPATQECSIFRNQNQYNIWMDRILNELLPETMLSLNLLDSKFYSKTRGLVNSFECLGRGPHRCFQNRSALKLSNLHFIVPDIIKGYQNKHFTFLDLCGGPGGFVEYLLLAPSIKAMKKTGVGMSLRIKESLVGSSCNWNLQKIHQPPFISVSFEDENEVHPNPESSYNHFYITYGISKDGDILSTENQNYLRKYVHQILQKSTIQTATSTQSPSFSSTTATSNFSSVASEIVQGVDLVTADGGLLDHDGDSGDREKFSLPLIISQVICMLGNLRTGGSFILKVFSMREAGTMEVFLLLHALFARVAIVKPVTSRPISSERYLVCLEMVPMSWCDRQPLIDRLRARMQPGYPHRLSPDPLPIPCDHSGNILDPSQLDLLLPMSEPSLVTALEYLDDMNRQLAFVQILSALDILDVACEHQEEALRADLSYDTMSTNRYLSEHMKKRKVSFETQDGLLMMPNERECGVTPQEIREVLAEDKDYDDNGRRYECVDQVVDYFETLIERIRSLDIDYRIIDSLGLESCEDPRLVVESYGSDNNHIKNVDRITGDDADSFQRLESISRHISADTFLTSHSNKSYAIDVLRQKSVTTVRDIRARVPVLASHYFELWGLYDLAS